MTQGLVGSDAYLEQWRWGDVEERHGTPDDVLDAVERELEAEQRERAAPRPRSVAGVDGAPRRRRYREPRPAALRRRRRRADGDVLRLRRDDARDLLPSIMLGVVVWALFSRAGEGHAASHGATGTSSATFLTLAGAARDRIAHPAHGLRAAAPQGRGRVREARSRARRPGRGSRRGRTCATRGSAGTRSRSSSCCSAAPPSCCSRAASTKRAAAPVAPRARGEAVSLALDESLDDLRADPDLRRAIVAAYARMERRSRSVGLGRAPRRRRPSSTSAGRSRASKRARQPRERLTTLFEWAKFSHHEPEPHMRDEAIDALVAVRDELRAARPSAVRGVRSERRRSRSPSPADARARRHARHPPVPFGAHRGRLRARARGDRARRARRGRSRAPASTSPQSRVRARAHAASPSSRRDRRSSCGSSARSRSARRAPGTCTCGCCRCCARRAAKLGVASSCAPSARELLGDDAWELLRPDRPEPVDRNAARSAASPPPLARRHAGAALMELAELRERATGDPRRDRALRSSASATRSS